MLVNRCNCVRKRSSYYSNHKKKMATAVGPKRRLGQRSSDTESPPRCFKSDSRKQGTYVQIKEWSLQWCIWISSETTNDKVMVVQRSLHKARCFTRIIMTRRTRLMRREDHWWDQHRNGWSCTKLHGSYMVQVPTCRREQASKLRQDDRSSKGAEARLSAGNSWSSTVDPICFTQNFVWFYKIVW